MIPRLIEKYIISALKKQKAILIFGARQVGKTTLIQEIMKKLPQKKQALYLNCDVEEEKRLVNTTSLVNLKKITDKVDYLFIDEVQRLENAGLTLKVIYDNIKSVNIIATGSSSLELKDKLSESLTGRYVSFTLYPFSLNEIGQTLNDEILLFGQYPEVFLTKKSDDKIRLLNNIIESHLFKDLLSFQKIRRPAVIADLVRALAYQIGSEIHENELANRLKIDRKTVASYLDILEKSYIIKKFYPFSKNPRREIGRRYKVYFLDLGLRNALIGDFNDLKIRRDVGAIWENFIIIEKLKSYENKQLLIDSFFWRSYGGAEVDLIEKSKTTGKIKAFEIKYQGEKRSRGAAKFVKNYKVPLIIINRNNYFSKFKS